MSQTRAGTFRLSARWLLPCIIVAVFVAVWQSTAQVQPGVTVETIVYGDAPSEFGRLHLPAEPTVSAAALPVVVMLHGGFWRRDGGDLSLMDPLAADLAMRGYAVWNVEYGRTGERFGGWPHTFNHVGAAVDHLDELAGQGGWELGNVSVVGHSAGGHLALWVAGREGFPLRSAWESDVRVDVPKVAVDAVVAVAPVVDVRAAGTSGLGNGAVADLLGGLPEDVPLRYAMASPQPSAGVEVLIVTGELDDTVPTEFTEADWEAATGPSVDRIVVPGEDHLRLISPESLAWRRVVEWLDARE